MKSIATNNNDREVFRRENDIFFKLSKKCDQKNLKIGQSQFDTFVTKNKEKILLTQKYKILSVRDPNTLITYDLEQIVKLNLIDKNTGELFLPSTNNFLQIDEGISLGIINARLVNQYYETTNESFQYVGHSFKRSNDSILKAKTPIVKFNLVYYNNKMYFLLNVGFV